MQRGGELGVAGVDAGIVELLADVGLLGFERGNCLGYAIELTLFLETQLLL